MPNEYETKTDNELVKLAGVDHSAFAVLISRYEAKITRYIYRLGVHDKEDQVDVLQDIFLKLYRNINSFDDSLTFSSWLYRIAHNEAISWYRHRSVRPEGHFVTNQEEVLSFMVSDSDSVEIKFDQKIKAETLNKALLEIDEKYREVIILRFFEHKEYEEISDILRIPVGSVGTLLFRGKKQLQTVLNRTNLRI